MWEQETIKLVELAESEIEKLMPYADIDRKAYHTLRWLKRYLGMVA